MTPMVPRIMGWLLLITTLSIPYMIYAPVVSAQTTEENSSESEAFQNFIAERNRQRIQVLNVAIQEDPENISLYNARGWYYFQLGDYEQTLSDYDRVIELGPENLEPYYQSGVYYVRGLSFLNLGDKQRAVESLRVAASLYESQNDLQGFSEVMELIESIELDN